MTRETLKQIERAYELQEYILDSYREIAAKHMNHVEVTEKEKIEFELLKHLVNKYISY